MRLTEFRPSAESEDHLWDVGVGQPLTSPKQAKALAVRLDRVYRDLWTELHRRNSDDLRQHEAELLSHVPAEGSVTLHWLSRHLLLPKSTASVLLKALESRGFVRRERRPENQRELCITLTPVGAERVAAATVLDTGRLATVLQRLPAADLESALHTLEQVASSHPRSVASKPAL